MTTPSQERGRAAPGRAGSWLRAGLESRWLPAVLALGAVLLTLPALWLGWQMDDYHHRLLLLGQGPPGLSPWQIFSGPEPSRWDALRRQWVDLGVYPWWTSADLRISFLRPLSVLTARIDYWLWPDSAALMHLHSLLWLGALIAAVTVLYRRLMAPGPGASGSWPAWTAGLAALLYAVDDAHGPPASWLANRNALVASLFGVLCLIAHDRWRRNGDRRAALLAPLWLALGLAAGEAALGAVGYLLAYALLLEPPTRRRSLSLLPCAAVLVGWAAIYVLGQFGVSGSGLYIDPVRSPLAFLRALGERVPFSLLGQWSPLPAVLGFVLPPEWVAGLWLIALAVIALIATALLPLLRSDRIARFWLAGMLLSLLPISATFPSDRLLSFVGLGAMPLLAGFLGGVWTGARWLPRSPLARRFSVALAILLLIVHLPLAALRLPLTSLTIGAAGEQVDVATRTLPVDARISEQELVLINVPDYLLFVTHIPTYRTLAGLPVPKRIRALTAGPTRVEITRVDERTLRARMDRGPFAGPLRWLFRSPAEPFAAGDRVELTGLVVEIGAVDGDGVPTEVDYRFGTPLEDPARRWLCWNGSGYTPFEVPPVGESVSLQPAVGPFDLFYGRRARGPGRAVAAARHGSAASGRPGRPRSNVADWTFRSSQHAP